MDQQGTYLTDSVADPGEMLRTAVRIFIRSMHRGLASLPPRLRQSAEAKQASQALYAASDFFDRNFDPLRLREELAALCEALRPLVTEHGVDPFFLQLYATGEMRRWQKKVAATPLPPR